MLDTGGGITVLALSVLRIPVLAVVSTSVTRATVSLSDQSCYVRKYLKKSLKPLANPLPNLIKFMAKFIKTVSPTEKVHLVAHDWGGAIAWPLTAFNPQLIDKLVIINAAHPSTFTREMIINPVQRDKSAYIHDLISKDAEILLSQKNYQYLSEKMMVCANQNIFTKNVKDKYRQVWQQPGAIKGMLQYYRAMPQLATISSESKKKDADSTGPVKSTAKMKIPNIRINVPTLILWGEQDQAFVKENLNGVEHYIPDCTVERFENASHWLMHEKPIEINNAIARFIKN